MRRRIDGEVSLGGGETSPHTPHVTVEVCRCGCRAENEPEEWPLAVAWAYLTRPVDGQNDGAYPWWDARSKPAKRKAVLPLVLLAELQAGVLLRALWEVVNSPGSPGA